MKILIAGDYCPQGRVKEQLDHGDYSIMDALIPYIQRADYSIVNLECPIPINSAEPISKHGPHLHADDSAIKVLKNIGISCVTLANNHFNDFGQSGINDTLSTLDQYGIDYVGGGKNIYEAEKTLFIHHDKETLAIVNCCEHEFSIAKEDQGGSNPINSIKQYYAIQEAKKTASKIIVIVHGGTEGYQLPSPRMQELYRFFVDLGADAVINHHQHCYSGIEIYKNKPIFYGLGNLCFDWDGPSTKEWKQGYIVLLNMEQKISYEIVPYIQGNIEPAPSFNLSDIEINNFKQHITQLSAIIANEHDLKCHYEEYIKQHADSLKLVFEPYTNRWLNTAFKKHLLPVFMRKKYNIIRDFIACESHREKILHILEYE